MCGGRRMIHRQLFEGEFEPSKERMKPILNLEYLLKPFGGLWTSCYDESRGSDWIQWCLGERFNVPDNGYNSWVLDVDGEPKMLIINSLAHLIKAFKTHGITYESDHPLHSFNAVFPTLDFEALSRDFDGMHLTARGQYETHLSYPESLYGWDCESTLWFRWCFSKVEHLGKKSFMVDDPDLTLDES